MSAILLSFLLKGTFKRLSKCVGRRINKINRLWAEDCWDLLLYEINNEGKWREVNKIAVDTEPSLSTGAAPILFQTEVTVTPTEGRRLGWSDRRTGPFQCLFSPTMGCFCQVKYTHTHCAFTLYWPARSSIWFTCPQGISSSCCQPVAPCTTI